MSGLASESPIKLSDDKTIEGAKQKELAVERSGNDHLESEERKAKEKAALEQQNASGTELQKLQVNGSSHSLRRHSSNLSKIVVKDEELSEHLQNLTKDMHMSLQDEDLGEPPKPEPEWRKKTRKCLDHYATVILMTLITFYALFFDDIRMIFFEMSQDDGFFAITLIGMIAFAVEILLASISMDEYFNSFFFWLDLVSTVSMIPDCGWIWDPLTGGGGGTDATDLAKTSRAGRVTRVIRVIRLIRLIRIVKLYKQAKLAQKKAQELQLEGGGGLLKRGKTLATLQKQKTSTQRIHPIQVEKKDDSFEKEIREIDAQEGPRPSQPEDVSPRKAKREAAPAAAVEEEEEDEIPLESKIGKTLSDRTTKIVIILVLIMLFSL